jgi:Domain of unknown function (DUF4430)
MRSTPHLLLVLGVALLLAGCGLGAGGAPRGVQLSVSENFGTRVLSGGPVKTAGQETVMRLLMRNYRITTRFGGGFVESIDGVSGGHEAGEPVDWFYYVNGVEATKGAAATDVHDGDHVWWDRHDWSQAQSIPAVVGSYPEPFLNGFDGRRYPVRIECANVTGTACRTVTARLRQLGVPAAIAAIGSGGEPEVIQLIVGPWRSVVLDPGTQSIEDGPGKSGVYARFAPDGSSLALLDPNGHVVRTLGAGAGLIAATRQTEEAPVWVVTGTDEAGLDRAAEALDEQSLEDHFAVAVAPQGTVPVPVAEE